MTFVDAGANIGFFTVLASRLVGPSGKVLAVEMMPPTARRLHHHLAANGCDNVQVVERALSDTSGQSLPVSMVDGSFGTATIAAELPKAAGSVQTATLDELLASIPSVDLMKMDLEGAEPNALAGANASMGKIKAIVFEELAGGPASAMLERAGYSVRRLSPQMSLAER